MTATKEVKSVETCLLRISFSNKTKFEFCLTHQNIDAMVCVKDVCEYIGAHFNAEIELLQRLKKLKELNLTLYEVNGTSKYFVKWIYLHKWLKDSSFGSFSKKALREDLIKFVKNYATFELGKPNKTSKVLL